MLSKVSLDRTIQIILPSGPGVGVYIGSANLTDSVWRFGSSRDDVVRTISSGVNQQDVEGTRNAVMPAFENRLSENDIKLLTVRVWSLGGGQK